MSKRRKPARTAHRARLARLLLRLFAALPLPVAHGLGGALGRMLVHVPNKLRRYTRINLDLCLPELEAAERERLTRISLVETGRTAAETGPLWFWDKERVLGLVKSVSGEHLVTEALQQGRGAILASPHLGAWELVGLYLSTRYPITSLYRPLRIRELDGMVRTARGRFGARLVPADAGGVRALYQALARGEMIGILPDQEPGRGNGVFAPFFGVPANTMSLLSRLALKAKAPVILVYAERLPRGAGYHLHFRPVPDGMLEGGMEESVRLLNAGVENCVRELPEQYQWSYKRFRSRPEGAAKIY